MSTKRLEHLKEGEKIYLEVTRKHNHEMTKQEMLDAIYTEMGIYQGPDSAPAVEFEPVLIGDVIEYIRLNNIWDINPITDEWDYPRLPINDQSDDAISFVYNLIKK